MAARKKPARKAMGKKAMKKTKGGILIGKPNPAMISSYTPKPGMISSYSPNPTQIPPTPCI
jgi:hypothetical protein